MYQCTNLLKKKHGDNTNTYMHVICIKNITPPDPYFTK